MEDKEIFDNWEYFKSLLRKTGRQNIEQLITYLDNTDFKFAPASTQYHNSFRGGLLKHSLDVYYHMYDFKPFINYFQIPEDTIILTALLHDICKVNCYKVSYRNVKNEEGHWVQSPYYVWDELEPLGHGEKSVIMCLENGVMLNKIEQAMIRNHMGFSQDEDKRRISALFTNCPQSLLVHWSDELATFVNESTTLSPKFRQRLVGRNLVESVDIISQIEKDQSIIIDGVQYKLAPQDSIVDNVTIGELEFVGNRYKIYLQNQN